MTRELAAVLVLAVLGVLLALMVLAWRRRTRRSAAPAAVPPPADRGTAIHVADGLYVATTAAGAPLDRISGSGLGFRARVGIEVTERGVLLRIAGSPDRWIAADAVRGADRATWTIDRVVERDGLVLLAWRAADRDLDSYLRVDDPAALIAALDRLAPAPLAGPTAGQTPAPKGAA